MCEVPIYGVKAFGNGMIITNRGEFYKADTGKPLKKVEMKFENLPDTAIGCSYWPVVNDGKVYLLDMWKIREDKAVYFLHEISFDGVDEGNTGRIRDIRELLFELRQSSRLKG